MDEITKIFTELEPDEEILIRPNAVGSSLIIRVTKCSKNLERVISYREMSQSKLNLVEYTLDYMLERIRE